MSIVEGNQNFPLDASLEEIENSSAVVVREALLDSQPKSALLAANATLRNGLEPRIQKLLVELPQATGATIACRKGCGLCCHRQVSVLPEEAIAMAELVRQTFNLLAQWGLRCRVDRYMKGLIGTGKRGACPFLKRGSCSIYADRPLMCRTHHSFDFAQCDLSRSALPANVEPFYDAMRPFTRGSMLAHGAGARPPFGIDLVAGLQVALNTPDAAEQLAQGKHPFANARVSRFLR